MATTETQTIILKVEGKTDGAVAATEKVTAAQKRMMAAAQAAQASMSNLAKTMVSLPPPPPAVPSAFEKISAVAKKAGVDTEELQKGFKEMGKGLAFDMIKQGVRGLTGAFDDATSAAVGFGVQGAALGAQLAGPLGAVAGALGGVIASFIIDESAHAARMKAYDDEIKRLTDVIEISRQYKESLMDIGDEYDNYDKKRAEAQTARVAALQYEIATAAGAVQERAQELRLAEAMLAIEQKIVVLRGGRADLGVDAATLIGRKRRDAEIDEKYAGKTYGPLLSGIELDLAHKGDELDNIKRALALPGLTPAVRRALLEKRNNLLGIKVVAGQGHVRNLVGSVSIEGERNIAAGDDRVGGMLGWAAPGSSARISDADNARIRAWEEMQNRRDAMYGRQADGKFVNLAGDNKPALERMFGSLDEINAYKTAFDGLTGAVSAGLQAWISGSESAGQAIKRFIGNYLGGVATQMAIESLKHAAYAIASLVPGPTFNPGAAGGHALAAAKFGLGAVAAAIAARELGGSGGSATTAGSGASTGGGSRGTSSPGVTATPQQPAAPQTNVTIVTGEAFDESSPRMRRLKADRMWERARGTTGVVQE